MKPLQYPEFAQKLYIHNNGIYTLEMSKDTGKISLFQERLTIGQPNGNQMRPKVREGKVRENKISEDKVTEGKVSQEKVSDPARGSDAAADDPGLINNQNKNGIIHITPKQVTELVEQMGLEDFTYYVGKLARFIDDNDAKVKNHHSTILKWWKEDQRL